MGGTGFIDNKKLLSLNYPWVGGSVGADYQRQI